jgi:hypothetical protein
MTAEQNTMAAAKDSHKMREENMGASPAARVLCRRSTSPAAHPYTTRRLAGHQFAATL